MNKRIITIEVLTPSEGCYLTQANRGEKEEPIMSKEVINPQIEWVNIPIAEGDALVARWQAEQEKRMQKEMTNATR